MIDAITRRFSPAVDAYADFVVRRRGLVLVLSVLLCLAGASGAARLTTQTTFRVWHILTSPDVIEYDQMLETFGSDDTALVAFQDPRGVLRNDALAAIDRMTQSFLRIDHVKRVDSLTNFSLVKTTVPGLESPALAVAGDEVYSADELEIVVFDRRTGVGRRLAGHEGMVEHLLAPRGGKKLISGGLDHQVIIWDLERGEPELRLRGLPEGVSSLALSPDEATVFAGSDGVVIGWSTSGDRRWRTTGLPGFVTQLATSPDGTALFAATTGVTVLDPATGSKVAEWKDPGSVVTALRVSPDGNAVYTASQDGRVLAYDPKSGAAVELLARSPVEALALAISAAGDTVHVALSDGSLRVIPVEGTKAKGEARTVKAHDQAILDVVVSKDGAIFSASVDRNASAAPATGGDAVVLRAHRAAVRRVLLSPDERELYTQGDDGAVYVWSLSAEEPVLVDRLSRTRTVEAPALTQIVGGAPVGEIEVVNQLRHPIDLRLSGESRGIIAAEQSLVIRGLPVGPVNACAQDRDCGLGQVCDAEARSCASPIAVEAYVPGQKARIFAAHAFLRAGEARTVRIPAEDAFSVQEVALSPLPKESKIGPFLLAFPTAKAAVEKVLTPAELEIEDTFVSPELAAKLQEVGAELPEPARKLLGELGERRIVPNRLPLQPHRLRDTKRALLRPPSPIAEGYVINPAADTTMVLVTLQQPNHEDALARMVHLDKEMDLFLERERAAGSTGATYEYHKSGEIIMDTTFKAYAESDMQTLGPVFAGICAFLLFLVFRRPAGVLLPLGSILMAIAFTMGLSGYFGASINNLTGAVPQVVMACCLGDAVHLLTGWLSAVRDGKDAREAAKETVRSNFWACTVVMETTIVGFLSMVTSEIRPIGTFGWMAAIGAFAAFVFTFSFMPAAMSMLPIKRSQVAGQGHHTKVEDLLARWGAFVVRRPRVIMLGAFAITAICSYGVVDLEFDTNPVTSFKRGTPFREASEFIERNIAGPVGLEIVVDTGEPRGVRKAKFLEAVAKVEEYVQRQPEVTKVVGLPSIHRSMNRAFNGDEIAAYQLPSTDARVSAYYDAYTLSLPAGMEINNRVSEDESKTRLSVRLRSLSSARTTEWREKTMSWINQNVPEVKASITGKFMVYAGQTNALTRSFLWNVGSAVILITLSMMVVLGSIRLGLVSMFPNIIPGIWAVGLISLLGLHLDVSIIVSLCVAIGVVVDDTIHFLVKFNEAHKTTSTNEALITTFRHAGVPLSFTTVVLCAGFGIFVASDYQVTSNFGLTATLTFLTGVVLDFTLTPALVKVLHRDL